MRKFLATTGLVLVLAACSAEQSEQSPSNDGGTASNAAASDVDARAESELTPYSVPAPPIDSGRNATPEVRPEAAPDVAFGYRYRFGIAADRIAGVQQHHARVCEELGNARCRVTGMNYNRRGEDRVEAELRLAIEPSLAHRFGQTALDSVRQAEGDLADSQITGTDVGTGIRASNRTIDQLQAELRELEQRIAAAGREEAKIGLRDEAAQLRERIRSLQDGRSEQREQLATTPVSLSYSSALYRAGEPDFGGAMENAWDQVEWGAYILFVVLTVLAPWLLAAGLIWWGVHAVRKRLPKAT